MLLTNLPAVLPPATVESAYVMTVADGMGGEVFGELASRLALTAAWEIAPRENAWLQNTGPLSLEQMREKAAAFSTHMHEAFQEQVRRFPETAGMGTTLTTAYVVGAQAFIGHAGDSRAYLVSGSEITRLTDDHTLAAEYRAQGYTRKEAARFKNILTNYLSESREFRFDVDQMSLGDGDLLLLCTDGLTDLVSDEKIAATVNAATTPQAACDALIALALEQGGKDNVTVVLGKFHFPAASSCEITQA
jgi:protein phosphatase